MATGGRRGPFGDADEPDAAEARRYSPGEVRDIFHRATEEEVRPSLAPAAGDLTLAEIQEVALEAGIDPALVRRVGLATLPPPPTPAGGRLFGGPARRVHRVFVPGRLPAALRPALTDALERVLDRELEVQAEEEDGEVRWKEDHRQGQTRITLREVQGGTEVELEADRSGWLALLGVGSGVTGVFASLFLATLLAGLPGWPLLVAVLALVLAVGGVRLVWAPFSRRLHRTLERALGEIVSRLGPGDASGEVGGANQEAALPPGPDAASPG